MSNLKKVMLAVVLLGMAGMAYFAYNVYRAFFSPNTAFTSGRYEIRIPTDATYQEAYALIAPAIKDKETFHQTATRKGYAASPKPGRYFLEAGMNNNDIINVLRLQNTAITLRFNNQERLENLAGRVASQLEVDSLSLLNSMRDPGFLEQHGFTKESALSMYLPNQYEVYWNTSADNFRQKMLNEYKAFWNEERLAKAAQLKLTPQEVSVIASIVHKETVKAVERPKVAGVYLNRIKSGWQLEADPTVIYAKKLVENNFNQVIKQVLFVDLDIVSPYNTYRTIKLPPGPIIMPDLNAIDAVLDYEKHDYYFFVADVENFGFHKFAKTGAQHAANAAVYRAWVAKQGYR